MTAKHEAGREWDYPVVDEAIDSAGIYPIGVYTKRRQTNISERVDCRPVYSLYTEAEKMTGTIQTVFWIKRGGGVINLTGWEQLLNLG